MLGLKLNHVSKRGHCNHPVWFKWWNHSCETALRIIQLNHLPLVQHVWVSEWVQHWFRLWLAAYTALIHYINQCWIFINWNKFQWNFNQNKKLFIHENAFENIVYEMAAILYIGKWVKSYSHQLCIAIVNGEMAHHHISLSGVPDYFYRNKISSGGDLSHYSSASLY